MFLFIGDLAYPDGQGGENECTRSHNQCEARCSPLEWKTPVFRRKKKCDGYKHNLINRRKKKNMEEGFSGAHGFFGDDRELHRDHQRCTATHCYPVGKTHLVVNTNV